MINTASDGTLLMRFDRTIHFYNCFAPESDESTYVMSKMNPDVLTFNWLQRFKIDNDCGVTFLNDESNYHYYYYYYDIDYASN